MFHTNKLLLIIVTFISLNSIAHAQNKTNYNVCDEHSFCNSNGFCYEQASQPQIKFCNCNSDYYGRNCEDKFDPLWEQLVIVLAVLCALLLLALIIAAYLLLHQNKGTSKEYQSHGESWTAVRVSKPQQNNSQNNQPMYSRPSLGDLEAQNTTSQQNGGNKFDIVDNGMDYKTNSFQPIPESEDEKNSEESTEKKDSESNPESPKENTIPVEKNPNGEDDKKQSEVKLTQENLAHYNHQERRQNLAPPKHARYTSQDSNEMQSMDEIYKNMYASGNPYSPETRKVSTGHRGQLIPIETSSYGTQPRKHSRQQVDRYGRPLSPTSHTSSRPNSRPMSPHSAQDVRLNPRARGANHHRQHSGENQLSPRQRSPIQGQQLGHRADYTDARGRPRSMGDLQMVGMMNTAEQQRARRHRARSMDGLDAVSVASSIENIHTGKVTRMVPSPKEYASQQRGRGIWARSAQR